MSTKGSRHDDQAGASHAEDKSRQQNEFHKADDDEDEDDDWFTKDIDEFVIALPKTTIEEPAVVCRPTPQQASSCFNISNDDDGNYGVPPSSTATQPQHTSSDDVAIKPMTTALLENLLDKPFSTMAVEILATGSGFLEALERSNSISTMSCVPIAMKLLATLSASWAFRAHLRALLAQVLVAPTFWRRVRKVIGQHHVDAKKAAGGGKPKKGVKPPNAAFLRDLCTFVGNLSLHGLIVDERLAVQLCDISAPIAQPFVDELRALIDASNAQARRLVDARERDFFARARDALLLDDWDAKPDDRRAGAVADVADYAQTHLRLLRVDFLEALRAGFQALRRHQDGSFFWMYAGKEIVDGSVYSTDERVSSGLVVRITLSDIGAAMRKQSVAAAAGDGGDESDDAAAVPFMVGALLLFASDLELADLVLATVIEHNRKEEFIRIQILRTFNANVAFLNRPMLMLEPRIYMDPHRQAHQRIATILGAGTMPLAAQLVGASVQPQLPAYYSATSKPTIFRSPFSVHLDLPVVSADGATAAAAWPEAHAVALGLNVRQLAAVQLALSSRVALIQGPPGTGKSFIGQHIVGLLLHNTALRIVAISYTNLALDQLVHGIVSSGYAGSESVVRLGGQCTDDAVAAYELRSRPKEKSTAKQQQRTANARINYHLYKQHVAIDASNAALLTAAGNVERGADDAAAALDAAVAQSATARERLEELRQLADYEEIKDRRVVCMTSSFAARNGTLVQLLRAPIVFVEEAAELLEAHVIAALTPHCQHLIQIGDHQQLQPATLSHRFAAAAGLNVSLFERLLRNGLPSVALNVQHRMHADIAQLLRPAIYADLVDAPCRDDDHNGHFAPPFGMPARLQFVDHAHGESRAQRGDTSAGNPGEAKLVQLLCAHLLRSGYTPDDIVVLSPYRRQLELLQCPAGRPNRATCWGCRVSSVDAFQGRESRVVLLSLVRNNAEGNVGFMASARRACVALSRAQQALYVFGNAQLMRTARGGAANVWPAVMERLFDGGYVSSGHGVIVKCERHAGHTWKITAKSDDRSGCGSLCGAELPCGHRCPSACHGASAAHNTNCSEH